MSHAHPSRGPRRRRPGRGALVFGLALAVVLALPAAAPAEEGSEGEDPTWYARRLSAGDSPVRVDYLWSKGTRLHAETVIAGHPIVTLVTGSRYVMYDRLSGEGVSIERSARAVEQDAGRGRPFGRELGRLRAEGAERVGTDRLGGRECVRWRVTDERGRRELCVTDDARALPVQLEVFDRRSGRSARTHYLDWTRGLALPDRFFEPGAERELERIGYQEYLERSAQGETLGPAPPLFAPLLHGR